MTEAAGLSRFNRTAGALSGVAWLGIALFGLVVTAGVVELVGWYIGNGTTASLSSGFAGIGDNWAPFRAAQAFVHWLPPAGAYAGDPNNAHPLPQILLVFVPLVFLPVSLARLIGSLACALFSVAALRLWAGPSPAERRAVWPALLAPPLVQLVLIDHLQAATGLAALSLAVWAQRRERWFLAGAAMAVAIERPGSALPILAMLAVASRGSPRRILAAVGGAAVVLVPICAASFAWDPGWVSHYLDNLRGYRMAGVPLLAIEFGGSSAFIVMQIGLATLAAWLTVTGPRGPLDLDRAALVCGLSLLTTPEQGLYSGIVLLPSLVRLGSRSGLSAAPWMLSGLAWLATLWLWPLLSGPSRGQGIAWLTLISFGLLVGTFPLARRTRISA